MSPHHDLFTFGCSILPFEAIEYSILANRGAHLHDLLSGVAVPYNRAEQYFIRCIREDADYDSHQSLEADAWRQWQERLAFEREYPPPESDRSWIRADELRGGMILFLDAGRAFLYETQVPETRGQLDDLEYRSHPAFSWRSPSADPGWWRCVTPLETGVLEERYIPPDEQFVVYDPPQQVMTLKWWNGPGEEMLLADLQNQQMYFVGPSRISHDVSSAGRLASETPIRIQWWEDEPFWVWGPV